MSRVLRQWQSDFRCASLHFLALAEAVVSGLGLAIAVCVREPTLLGDGINVTYASISQDFDFLGLMYADV